MPAGLQTWDEAGNLIVDTSTILLTYLGALQIGTGSPASGTISNPNFAGRQIFYHLFLQTSQAWEAQPTAQVIGGAISWAFPTAARPGATILYGVR